MLRVHTRGLRTCARRVARVSAKDVPKRGSFKIPVKVAKEDDDDEKLRISKFDKKIFSGYNTLMQQLGIDKHDEVTIPKSRYQLAVMTIQGYLDARAIRQDPVNRGSDSHLWKLVSDLKPIKPLKSDQLALELLLELLEIGKLQPDRFAKIKLVCDIIYSYGARLDAINEADYIDALFTKGHRYRALELWKTRDRETQESMYWQEVGATLHIRRYDAAQAEAVASKMVDTHGYVPPKLMIEFIRMYAEKMESAEMMRWYHTFLTEVSTQGFESDEQQQQQLKVTSQTQMDDALGIANQRHKPTETQWSAILEILLYRHHWNEAERVVRDMDAMGIVVPVGRILELLDRATKQLTKDDTTHPTRSLRRASSSKVPLATQDFVPLLSTLININPRVLNSQELYQSWLRGLTAMGLYQNAFQVLDAMIERDIAVDAQVLIRALLAKNQLELAETLLTRMQHGERGLPSPTSSTYSLFIQHASRHSDGELIDRLLKQDVPLNEPSMNTLLTHFSTLESNEFDKFVNTLASDTTAYSTFRTAWLLLRKRIQHGYNSTTADLHALMHKMISSPQFHHSVHVYETAIHTMLLSNDPVGAAGVLAYMDRQGIQPQTVLYLGILQVATRLKSRSRVVFPKSRDVGRQTMANDPAVPWREIVQGMCGVLEVDADKTILQAETLFK